MIASRLRPFFGSSVEKLEIYMKFFSATSLKTSVLRFLRTYATAKMCKENFEFLFTTEPPAPPKLRCLLCPCYACALLTYAVFQFTDGKAYYMLTQKYYNF